MNISINEDALAGMQALLGEQFADTVVLCCSEFERLESEIRMAFNNDKQEAIRHAHSLKSNAAQFGATSLSNLARAIEQGLIQDDLDHMDDNLARLAGQVSGSKSQLLQWLEVNCN